jgi:hypothetical protein
MESFSEPIAAGCIAGVQESASDDETAVRYQYDGSDWQRSAVNQPYVWTSTNAADIANTDPSGIGVTRLGDVLRITLANGTRSFRLKRFATPGDIVDADVWVPAEWLESGTVKLWSFLVGDEADRSTSGLTDVISGGGSITGDVDGRTRCLAGAASSNAYFQVTSLALAAGEQVYFRALTRAATPSGATVLLWAGDGTNLSNPRQTAGGNIGFFDGSSIGSSSSLRSSGSQLPSTAADDELVEMLDEGRTVQSTLYRGGGVYHAFRRNAYAAAVSTAFIGAFNSLATMDLRHLVVITRTP